MTPDQLRTYLKVCREEGLMAVNLELTGGIKVAATFGPGPIEPAGDPIDKERAPGEWKQWAGEAQS